MCDCYYLGLSDTVILGIGQAFLGGAIALWAIFKTRKDATKLQNDNLTKQMQQQIRLLVVTAYNNFRNKFETLIDEYSKQITSQTDYSQALLLLNQYFPQLRSAMNSFITNLFLIGSKPVLEICQEIGEKVNQLNNEYLEMASNININQPEGKPGDPDFEKWAEDSIRKIVEKIEQLKRVYGERESKLLNTIRKDMGIEL